MRKLRLRAAASWLVAMSQAACGGDHVLRSPDIPVDGVANIELTVAHGVMLDDDVAFTVTMPGTSPITGTFIEVAGKPYLVAVLELAPSDGYVISASAPMPDASTDCSTSATFDVRAELTSHVQLVLDCGGATLSADAGTSHSGHDGSDAGAPAAHDDASTSEPRHDDAGAATGTHDAGTGIPDAAVDASTVADASAPIHDASTPDAALDASPRDASTGDASFGDASFGDARVADAATQDAAASDASRPDASMMDAASDASTPSDGETCDECSTRACRDVQGVDRQRDCYAASGTFLVGPAEGQSRASVCMDLMECAHQTGCGMTSILACYCDDANASNCMAFGPCVAPIEAAGSSTNPATLSAATQDSTTLLGAATQLLRCESTVCAQACFAAP